MKNHKFQQIRVTVTKPETVSDSMHKPTSNMQELEAFMFLFLKNALFLDACWV